MKTAAILLSVAITLIAGADDPTSPSAVKARRTYEDTLHIADEQHREAVKVVDEQYLRQLQDALDAALTSKDLRESNRIDSVMKAKNGESVSSPPTSPLAVKAIRSHEQAIQSAQDALLQTQLEAQEAYIKEMQAALDTALAARNLDEANRIDETIKSFEKTVAGITPDSKLIDTAPGFVLETWVTGLGDIRGVTVGRDGKFGTAPFVYSVTRRAVLRIPGKNRMQTFAKGFGSGRSGRIVFAPAGDDGGFRGDMFVSAPADGGSTSDVIYRVVQNGQSTVFHSGPKSMTKGIAFGHGTGFGDFLYVINAGGRSLWRIDPSSVGSALGSGVSSEIWEDDMIITKAGGAFGENAFLTDQAHSRVLRMTAAGKTTAFANVPGAMSIALGEGVFGDYLYIGTSNGSVFRVSPGGEVAQFMTGFGSHSPEGNFRGIEVEADQMWITTDTGELLRVTVAP